MTLWLINEIRKILIAIHSKQTPNQLATGVVFGVILGLLPKGFLVFILVLFLYFFELNLAINFLITLLVSALTPFMDPISHSIGRFLLVDASALTPLWTFLYELPIFPYTRFYNTVVLGSFVLGLLLAIPMFFLAKKAVLAYRSSIKKAIDKHPVVVKFKNLKWVAWFSRFLDGDIV